MKNEAIKDPMKVKKVKIDKDSFYKLKAMFQSPDKENHTVALLALQNCNVKESLPFVLMLYKLFNESSSGAWSKETPDLIKSIEKTGVKLEGKMTMNKLYDHIQGKYSKEDIQVILDEMAAMFHSHMKEWGFKCLSNMELSLKEKD